jgi:hypothetical protein
MQQQDQPSPFGLDEARAFIERATWVYARTAPGWPHWYAVRRDCAGIGLDADFVAFQAWIETAGYDRWWGWRTWRTLDVGGRADKELIYGLGRIIEIWPETTDDVTDAWVRVSRVHATDPHEDHDADHDHDAVHDQAQLLAQAQERAGDHGSGAPHAGLAQHLERRAVLDPPLAEQPPAQRMPSAVGRLAAGV